MAHRASVPPRRLGGHAQVAAAQPKWVEGGETLQSVCHARSTSCAPRRKRRATVCRRIMADDPIIQPMVTVEETMHFLSTTNLAV